MRSWLLIDCGTQARRRLAMGHYSRCHPRPFIDFMPITSVPSEEEVLGPFSGHAVRAATRALRRRAGVRPSEAGGGGQECRVV